MQVVYGGGTSDEFFGDLWAFDFGRRRWELLSSGDEASAPPPRDHHTAFLAPAGRLVVCGGRTGPSAKDWRPLGDCWAYDFEATRWEELQQRGLRPLPRFAAAAATTAQQDGAGDSAAKRSLMAEAAWQGRAARSVARGGGAPKLVAIAAAAANASPRCAHRGCPAGGGRAVIFGGETLHGCKLNDAWELDLHTLQWEELSAPAFCTRDCSTLFGGD
jgi:hypothetical protein